MAFGRQYHVELPDGSALGLRQPTAEEFDRLLPVPKEVLAFNPFPRHTAGGYEFPYLETGKQMVNCLGYEGTRDLETWAWGIEYNGRLVGAAGVDRDLYASYPSYFIDILDSEVWGKGIGTAVTVLVAHDTFARGYRAVASGAHPRNKASRTMHFRAGFVPTAAGLNPDTPDGTWDEFIMPAPKGRKPAELTQEQTDDARRMFAEQLGALVFRQPR